MGTLGIDKGIKFIFLCFWVWLWNEFEANGNKIYAKGKLNHAFLPELLSPMSGILDSFIHA